MPYASLDHNSCKLNVRNNVLERVEAVKLRAYVAELIIDDYLGDIRTDKADNVSIFRNECLLPID